MERKKARILVSTIILLLVVFLQWKGAFKIVRDFQSVRHVYTVDDFVQINNYDVDGNTLIPKGDDPQIILEFDGIIFDINNEYSRYMYLY